MLAWVHLIETKKQHNPRHKRTSHEIRCKSNAETKLANTGVEKFPYLWVRQKTVPSRSQRFMAGMLGAVARPKPHFM